MDMAAAKKRLTKADYVACNCGADYGKWSHHLDVCLSHYVRPERLAAALEASEEAQARVKPVCRSPVHCLCVYAAASRVGSVEYWWEETKREREEAQKELAISQHWLRIRSSEQQGKISTEDLLEWLKTRPGASWVATIRDIEEILATLHSKEGNE